MKIIYFVWRLVWKTLVVAVVLVVGSCSAEQVGWSGAELVVNLPFTEPFERLAILFFFSLGTTLTAGSVILVYIIAKHALWFVVPVFLYFSLALGVSDGFLSDFDATRTFVIKNNYYANAYALEKMSPRALFRTCEDGRIELTDDAKAVCARVSNVAPGERIPGSEYRCGLLDMFACYKTAPQK